MRENESKADEHKSRRAVPVSGDLLRPIFSFGAVLGLTLAVAASFGCASPQKSDGQPPPAASPNGLPEITDEVIAERINDARVGDVPEESGTGDPIYWSFDEDEPKEIKVVDKQVSGPQATIVLDVRTRSGPHTRNPRELAGQIRTEWRLRTGWVLRRWEIVDTENISMKYKNLTKPPEQTPAR